MDGARREERGSRRGVAPTDGVSVRMGAAGGRFASGWSCGRVVVRFCEAALLRASAGACVNFIKATTKGGN